MYRIELDIPDGRPEGTYVAGETVTGTVHGKPHFLDIVGHVDDATKLLDDYTAEDHKYSKITQFTVPADDQIKYRRTLFCGSQASPFHFAFTLPVAALPSLCFGYTRFAWFIRASAGSCGPRERAPPIDVERFSAVEVRVLSCLPQGFRERLHSEAEHFVHPGVDLPLTTFCCLSKGMVNVKLETLSPLVLLGSKPTQGITAQIALDNSHGKKSIGASLVLRRHIKDGRRCYDGWDTMQTAKSTERVPPGETGSVDVSLLPSYSGKTGVLHGDTFSCTHIGTDHYSIDFRLQVLVDGKKVSEHDAFVYHLEDDGTAKDYSSEPPLDTIGESMPVAQRRVYAKPDEVSWLASRIKIFTW